MCAERHAGHAVRIFLTAIQRQEARDVIERSHERRDPLVHPGGYLYGHLSVRHRCLHYPTECRSCGPTDRVIFELGSVEPRPQVVKVVRSDLGGVSFTRRSTTIHVGQSLTRWTSHAGRSFARAANLGGIHA